MRWIWIFLTFTCVSAVCELGAILHKNVCCTSTFLYSWTKELYFPPKNISSIEKCPRKGEFIKTLQFLRGCPNIDWLTLEKTLGLTTHNLVIFYTVPCSTSFCVDQPISGRLDCQLPGVTPCKICQDSSLPVPSTTSPMKKTTTRSVTTTRRTTKITTPPTTTRRTTKITTPPTTTTIISRRTATLILPTAPPVTTTKRAKIKTATTIPPIITTTTKITASSTKLTATLSPPSTAAKTTQLTATLPTRPTTIRPKAITLKLTAPSTTRTATIPRGNELIPMVPDATKITAPLTTRPATIRSTTRTAMIPCGNELIPMVSDATKITTTRTATIPTRQELIPMATKMVKITAPITTRTATITPRFVSPLTTIPAAEKMTKITAPSTTATSIPPTKTTLIPSLSKLSTITTTPSRNPSFIVTPYPKIQFFTTPMIWTFDARNISATNNTNKPLSNIGKTTSDFMGFVTLTIVGLCVLVVLANCGFFSFWYVRNERRFRRGSEFSNRRYDDKEQSPLTLRETSV